MISRIQLPGGFALNSRLIKFRVPVVALLIPLLLSNGCAGRQVATLYPPSDPREHSEFEDQLRVGDDVQILLLDGREYSGILKNITESSIALKLRAPISSVRRGEVKIIPVADIESIALLDRRAQKAAGLALSSVIGAAGAVFLLLLWAFSDFSGWDPG
jgi:hypothetical protein